MKKNILCLLTLGLIFSVTPKMTINAALSDYDNNPFKISGTFGQNADSEYIVSWQSKLPAQQLELAPYADILYSNSEIIDATMTNFVLTDWNYAARNICRVHLSDLTPNYTYRYRVGYGELWSTDYTFTTQKKDDFSFVFISDPQASTLEEYRNLNSITNRAYNETPNMSFFLLGGDVTDIAGIENQFDIFFQSFTALRDVPLLTVIGNHDTMKTGWTEIKGESRVFDAHFGTPGNGPLEAKNTTYYSYINDCLFVTLNTQLSDANLATQATWLDSLLEYDQQHNLSRYIIITMNRGILGNYYYGNSTIGKINALYVPVFDKYGVDLVLSGHDHNYGRTQKWYNNQVVSQKDGKGTAYIIGGATGPKYNAPNSASLSQFVKTASNIGVYTKFSVDNEKITVLAKNENGVVIDSCIIPAKRHLDETSLLKSVDITPKSSHVDMRFSLGNYNYISNIKIERLDGTVIDTLSPEVTNYTFINLESDSTYKFNIRVTLLDNTSSFQQISFKTKSNLTIKDITSNSAKITFNNNLDITHYKIYLDNIFVYQCSVYFMDYVLINLASKRNYTATIEYYNSEAIVDSDYILFRTL